MQIGPYRIDPPVVLAPMAGVTDKPFRLLCKRMGAGMAVSEMTISDPRFWNTAKSRHRMDHAGEPDPISVQIAGTDPKLMADAARYNVDHGAQIIDINMGCPAKKVCNVWAGSALMQNESLAARILEAVTQAVPVPVTLKMRSGWDSAHRNAPRMAVIAEQCGIAALAVHGRTRDQQYRGHAEYETIAAVKASVRIPVMANGDIDSAEKAREVIRATGCDAVMIGRAAQGRPWIFRSIAPVFSAAVHDVHAAAAPDDPLAIMLEHIDALHRFYGERSGTRIARKHVGWYLRARPDREASDLARIHREFNACDDAGRQLDLLRQLPVCAA